jgi:hypothetical protein
MKNGRFSGKNTSKRWLIVTCGSSDSTWLKSGFSVRSTVNASFTTTLPSIPALATLSVSNAGTSTSRKRARVKAPYGMNW